jgi:hypothetical protein
MSILQLLAANMPKLIWIGSTAKFDVRADGEGKDFPERLNRMRS